jgi:predicted transcriptional regulator
LEQFVAEGDSTVDERIECDLDTREGDLLKWVNANGPSKIRRLLDQAGFNYSTVKPRLDRLVALDLLKLNREKEYELTISGASTLFTDWSLLTMRQRLNKTNPANWDSLGLLSYLLVFPRPPEVSLEAYENYSRFATSERETDRLLAPWLLLSAWKPNLMQEYWTTFLAEAMKRVRPLLGPRPLRERVLWRIEDSLFTVKAELVGLRLHIVRRE